MDDQFKERKLLGITDFILHTWASTPFLIKREQNLSFMLKNSLLQHHKDKFSHTASQGAGPSPAHRIIPPQEQVIAGLASAAGCCSFIHPDIDPL